MASYRQQCSRRSLKVQQNRIQLKFSCQFAWLNCCCCELISADMTKALLCTINSAHVGPYSGIQKLFGDPDGYAYKLDNRTFVDTLPIHMNGLRVQIYDFFHSISIDYGTQRVHYGNNFRKRLEYGLYVYSNSTTNYDYDAVPETNQVCPRPTFYSKPNEQYGFMTIYSLRCLRSIADHRQCHASSSLRRCVWQWWLRL